MITIATDGSCIVKNGTGSGDGAYGFVVDHNDSIRERAIPVPSTTVGEMEVRALLEALLYVAQELTMSPVRIICDSQYVVNGYNDWMANWEAKGWHKKGGLAHAQLWMQIAAAKKRVGDRVTVEWIRAHQNKGTLNDQVDALVNACARTQRAVNGPALQDSLGLVASQQPAAPASGSEAQTFGIRMPFVDQSVPGGNANLGKPTYDELVALLRQSYDMITHLRTPPDTGAYELCEEISNTLERI